MTQKEKMKALEGCLYEHCSCNNCDECEFYDEDGIGHDEYFCGIRDGNGNIPYYDNWNMKIALGLEEPYKPVFPEAVEESIMRHFTKGE